jgi:hypothetical protein
MMLLGQVAVSVLVAAYLGIRTGTGQITLGEVFVLSLVAGCSSRSSCRSGGPS